MGSLIGASGTPSPLVIQVGCFFIRLRGGLRSQVLWGVSSDRTVVVIAKARNQIELSGRHATCRRAHSLYSGASHRAVGSCDRPSRPHRTKTAASCSAGCDGVGAAGELPDVRQPAACPVRHPSPQHGLPCHANARISGAQAAAGSVPRPPSAVNDCQRCRSLEGGSGGIVGSRLVGRFTISHDIRTLDRWIVPDSLSLTGCAYLLGAPARSTPVYGPLKS